MIKFRDKKAQELFNRYSTFWLAGLPATTPGMAKTFEYLDLKTKRLPKINIQK